MVESTFLPCPCCIGGGFFLPVLVAAVLGLLSVMLFSVSSSTKGKNEGTSKRRPFWIRMLLVIMGSVLLGISLLIGSLALHKDFRYRFFAWWFSSASQTTAVDEYRCAPMRGIQGRVLEIGPGGGVNFHCWADDYAGPGSELKPNITSWEGIEINKYFNESLVHYHQQAKLPFPMKVHWINDDASNLQLEEGVFDAVVMTHVLCSVAEVDSVLRTIGYALKPGAKLYFLEHVAASPTNSVHTSYIKWQAAFSPLLRVIGNGCQFKATGQLLQRAVDEGGVLAGYTANITHFDLQAMPLPFLRPHVTGTITKPI